jgi:hypothetical protein
MCEPSRAQQEPAEFDGAAAHHGFRSLPASLGISVLCGSANWIPTKVAGGVVALIARPIAALGVGLWSLTGRRVITPS